MIRSQQVAQVLLQPFRYNPVNHRLTVYSKLTVEVVFNLGSDLPDRDTYIDEGAFESILQNQLVNYEVARYWRVNQVSQKSFAPASSHNTPAYKIEVPEDGMVKVSYSALAAASNTIDSINPQTLRLTNQNIELPIMVEGESDGVFNTSDYLLFYGQKVNTRFTNNNIYWLTWGDGNGLRMSADSRPPTGGSTPTSFTATVHREQNWRYAPDAPSGPDRNRMYWSQIAGGYKDYTINLTNVASSPGSAVLRGFVKGYAADPQHRIIVSVNGHQVLDAVWPAKGEYTFTAAFDQSFLVNGSNTITVSCPQDSTVKVNQVLFDWFEIDYNKTFVADGIQTHLNNTETGDIRVTGFSNSNVSIWEITDPKQPVIITNATITPNGSSSFDVAFHQSDAGIKQYLIASPSDIPAIGSERVQYIETSNLTSPSNAADYLIISHPAFIDAIQPLANYYTSNGMRVRVVNVADIYNEFSDGFFTPNAIHDFLSYAYSNWERPAPTYVLLVGDGNYDYKNETGYQEPEFIPPIMAEADQWLGETAADNRFVTVSGEDILPDMALGRLPVQTAEQAADIVEKTLNYLQNGSQNWGGKSLFLAGKTDPSAGNFAALSDEVIEGHLPPDADVERIYYTDGSMGQQAVINAVNEGRSLVHFVGHSNQTTWFGDVNNPPAPLLTREATLTLTNADQYPIVLSMTCLTGYFIQPSNQNYNFSTLDENWIRAERKGAAAVWSPTGLGVASGHNFLDAGFFDAIYDDHINAIGLAINQAKFYLYSNSGGSNRDLIDTYVLFGDPAMLYQSTPTGPVLNYFTAHRATGGIELSWETVSEVTLSGFDLYRREPGGTWQRINGRIPAKNIGQPQGAAYTYLDAAANPVTAYEYKLVVIANSLQSVQTLTTTYMPFVISLPFLQK